jgi:hypothetical protein
MGIPTTQINEAIDEGKRTLAHIGGEIHHCRKIGHSPGQLLDHWKEVYLLVFALDGWEQDSDGTVPDSVDNPFTQVEMEQTVSRIHKLSTYYE